MWLLCYEFIHWIRMIWKYKFLLFLYRLFSPYGIKPLVYLTIRVFLIPTDFYYLLDSVVKKHTSILDIWCGYGIVSLYALYKWFTGAIYWLDIDVKRIWILQDIIAKNNYGNVIFEVRDFIKDWFYWLEWYQVWILVDILHHLDYETQLSLLDHVSKNIQFLLIKDIDILPKRKYYRNYFHDRIIMQNSILCFQWSKKIINLLKNKEYKVEKINVSSFFPYPHYLLSCKKSHGI